MAETAAGPSAASGGGAVAVREASDLGRLTRRAPAGRPRTLDEEAGTAEAVLSAGEPVQRFGEQPGGGYGPWVERLSIPGADLARLIGAPLLVDHRARSEDQVGVVESATRTAAAIEGVLRFGSSPRAREVLADVAAGIRRQLSLGYTVHEWRRSGGTAEAPEFTAARWTPLECSIVTIAAEAGARFRSLPSTSGVHEMATEPAAVPSADTPAAGCGATGGERGLPFASGPTAAEERARVADIMRRHGRMKGRHPQIMQRAVEDGWDVERFTDAMFDADADAQAARYGTGPVINPDVRAGGWVAVRGGFSGDDPAHVRTCVEDVVAHRLSGGRTALPEPARRYRGLRLPELCRHLLEAEGVRGVRFMDDVSVVRRFMGRAGRGMMTTSDLPGILANSVGKALLPMFEDVRSELLSLAFREAARDFKEQPRLRPGEFPALAKVLEGGEYTFGSIGEQKETFTVAKFGKMLRLSWEMVVNDDLDALGQPTRKALLSAATLEASLLAGTIGANPVMSDGNAVFSAAHGNLAGTGAALSVASIAAARAAMRLQKGLDGTTAIDVRPAYLVVPVAQQAAAEQVLAEIAPAKTSDSNAPVRGLQIVSDPRLDAGSATAWFLFAAPGRAPGLVIAFLEGTDGVPFVETRDGWTVDAVEIKVRHVVGTAFVDWRPAYKNPGA